MPKSVSPKTLLKMQFKTYPFTGLLKKIFGCPSTSGIWLIFGKDKNGKTWGTLLLCNLISALANILYVSAEEGLEVDFVAAIKRAQISHDNANIKFVEYESIPEVKDRFKKGKRNKPNIIVLDNLTMYNDMGGKGMIELERFAKDQGILIICLAHEERNEPYTSAAKMAKKLAKVIIRVQGLALIVSGRVPGGTITINEEKACLYHGTEIKEN